MNDSLASLQLFSAMAKADETQHNAGRPGNMNMEQAQKVAQDFEAVFIAQMLKPMFENANVEPPFGAGKSEKLWQDMQVDEYGKAIAKNGGFGLADSIVSEMLKMQENR